MVTTAEKVVVCAAVHEWGVSLIVINWRAEAAKLGACFRELMLERTCSFIVN